MTNTKMQPFAAKVEAASFSEIGETFIHTTKQHGRAGQLVVQQLAR